MTETAVKKLANAYKEKYWNDFFKCFPTITAKNEILINVPNDILSALIGLIGEEQVEQWMNYKFEDLDNMKPIDLVKTNEGLKALKMYILSMPN